MPWQAKILPMLIYKLFGSSMVICTGTMSSLCRALGGGD